MVQKPEADQGIEAEVTGGHKQEPAKEHPVHLLAPKNSITRSFGNSKAVTDIREDIATHVG